MKSGEKWINKYEHNYYIIIKKVFYGNNNVDLISVEDSDGINLTIFRYELLKFFYKQY